MAKAGITLSDFSYTRPRQSICVDVPHAGLHHDCDARDPVDRDTQGRSVSDKQKGRTMGAAFRFIRGNFPGRSVAPWKIAYPAARRLSAEDLPERRSATIS